MTFWSKFEGLTLMPDDYKMLRNIVWWWSLRWLPNVEKHYTMMMWWCSDNVLSASYALTAQNNNTLLMALKLLNISQIWLWLFAIIRQQYNVNTSNRNCPMSYFYCHLRPLHHSLLEITVSIKKCENGNVKLLRIFKLNAASNKIFRGLRNE